MTPLCELAKKYGTDKYPWYTPFYHLLLRNRRVETVLEIGVGTPQAMQHVPGYQPGASLRMWSEYFPEALVIGFDKDLTGCPSKDPNYTFCEDQNDPQHLAELARSFGPFDLIVDDGSHDPAHQISCFNALFPLLTPCGLYIIEDVNGPLDLEATHQYVECRVPESPYAGKLIVVSK